MTTKAPSPKRQKGRRTDWQHRLSDTPAGCHGTTSILLPGLIMDLCRLEAVLIVSLVHRIADGDDMERPQGVPDRKSSARLTQYAAPTGSSSSLKS